MYEYNVPTPDWKHAVIVDGLEGDTCNGENVTVAAHSVDAYQRSLSDYGQYHWYPVEMVGYFNYGRDVFLPLIIRSLVGLIENQSQNPYPAPEDMINLLVRTPTPNPYPKP